MVSSVESDLSRRKTGYSGETVYHCRFLQKDSGNPFWTKKPRTKLCRAEPFIEIAPLPSRLYCRYRNCTDSTARNRKRRNILTGRGLYRRWGIAPRPEELYKCSIHEFLKNASPLFPIKHLALHTSQQKHYSCEKKNVRINAVDVEW